MSDCDCRVYVDRLLAEQNRWVDVRFAGSDRVWSEKLSDLEKRLEVQQTADQRALELASKSISTHFDVVNNFQKRIEAMEKLYVTRDQLDARLSLHRLMNLFGLIFAAGTFFLYLWRGH